jgi:hypothetical protein
MARRNCPCLITTGSPKLNLSVSDPTSDPSSRGDGRDFLDKPFDHGGLALSRPIASAALAPLIIALIVILPQRAGNHPARAAISAG